MGNTKGQVGESIEDSMTELAKEGLLTRCTCLQVLGPGTAPRGSSGSCLGKFGRGLQSPQTLPDEVPRQVIHRSLTMVPLARKGPEKYQCESLCWLKMVPAENNSKS